MGRRLPLNEAAFDELTPEARYWAGFLMADGHVGADGRSLSIVQRESDGHIIVDFLHFMQSPSIPYRGSSKLGSWLTGRVGSIKLVERLAALGVTREKTFHGEACAELANDPDFWRGVVDGDGCIRLSVGGRSVSVYIRLTTASLALAEQFMSFVRQYVNTRARPRKDKRSNCYNIDVRNKEVAHLLQAMYCHGGPALLRKRELAEEIIERVEAPDYSKRKPSWNHSEQEKKQMQAEYLSGMFAREVAKKHNMSTTGLTGILRRLGTKMRSRGRPAGYNLSLRRILG